MKRPPDRPIPAAAKPLTPQNLLNDFGARAVITRDGVQTLLDALDVDDGSSLERWKLCFGRWAGQALAKLPRHLARLATRYGVSNDVGHATALLLALQTYYALVVKLLAERFRPGGIDDGLPDNPFAWCESSSSMAVGRLVEQLRETLVGYRMAAPADDGDCDLFKPLYQDLFPRPLRHQLGEYYTPDWLAGHVLDQTGYTGELGQRLLDPACGSGTFLLMALRRLRRGAGDEGRGARDGGRSVDPLLGCRRTAVQLTRDGLLPPVSPSFVPNPPPPSSPLVGFDLNPLAVMTARANYLIAMADLLPERGRVELPIYLRDSILGTGEGGEATSEQFDFVVGNPPWIAWDNLPEEDRRATKPLWERYGLFSLSGNEARHGGGKKDLSMLMLYAAADRYLKPGGRLGMVITQTLFQTRGAGDGFRRFRLGTDGLPLKVLRVDDMAALRPFDAANWTSTIVLQKGAATEYPVPYYRWEVRRDERGEGRGGENDECGMMNDECQTQAHTGLSIHHSSFITHHFSARPIDPAKPTSPWLIDKRIDKRGQNYFSPTNSSDPFYLAHLGANSGGANGVYWVEVLGQQGGGVLIRNITAKSKNPIETIEQVIEPDLLYPLLRWSDVHRYSAVPRSHILLAQDPATRTGIAEAVMRQRFPRTLAYLEQFHEPLLSRAAYRRYQGRGPFYSMYNVGPYTIAPVKVVWRRMDRRINAAVVESSWCGMPAAQPRPTIPQETCVLVACDSADEAHYVCAVLNSAMVNELVLAHSVRGGKGFGTPGMLEYVPLARYRPDDPRHVELASLSRQAHAVLISLSPADRRARGAGSQVSPVAELQCRIDELVSHIADIEAPIPAAPATFPPSNRLRCL
jgi:hypothetical protein